jgi:hypothetical protein
MWKSVSNNQDQTAINLFKSLHGARMTYNHYQVQGILEVTIGFEDYNPKSIVVRINRKGQIIL